MRFIILSFAILLFLSTQLTGQNLDSLLSVEETDVGPGQARLTYHKALELSLKAEDYRSAGLTAYKLGRSLNRIAEIDSSSQYLFSAIKHFSIVKDSANLSKTLLQIGNNFTQVGAFDSATNYVVRSIELAKRHGSSSDLSSAYNSLGNIYSDNKQYAKGLELYRKALEFDIDNEHSATIFSNMALCYHYLNEDELARLTMDKAKEACASSSNERCKVYVQSKMVMIYLYSDQLDSAAKYGKRLIQFLEETDQKEILMIKYNQMGIIYMRKSMLDTAQLYYEKSLELAYELKVDKTHFLLANLAFIAQKQGEFKTAYEYLYQHVQIRDSLDLLKADKRFEDLLVKYEAAEQEQQITRLEKEQLTQKVIVIIGCIILIALIVLLIIYRQKIKATKLVAEKIREINERKTKALQQENELKQIKARIEGQEKERLRIAKELHDSIAGNLAGIKLGLSRMSENYSDDQAITQIKTNIDQTYNEVRSISTNLSPLKTSDFTFLEMVKRYVEGMSHLHGFELEFDDNTTSDLLSLTDELKLELYRVFQELINNIVKHSNATLVEISLNELEDQLNIIIEDDGCGFDESRVIEGMGLKNIASRIAILKGEFHIDSVPGRGTITNIDIPFLENNMLYA